MWIVDTGILLAVAPPVESALDPALVDRAIEAALASAAQRGIRGKSVTPHLLAEVRAQTQGLSLAANVALVRNNARVAAEVAVALAHSSA